MEIVFCKPDALSGLHSIVPRLRASSLLFALASACDSSDLSFIPENLRALAGRAAKQIHERSMTELTFKGSVAHKQESATRLRQSVSLLEDETLPTLSVLRQSIEGLGFSIEEAYRHVCTESDVEAIYPSHPGRSGDIHLELIDYLVGHPIEIWWLSGEQHPCVLQWWKTYVRHLFKDRLPNQEYLIRNLVHVCDGEDRLYLSRLLLRYGERGVTFKRIQRHPG